MQVTAPVRPADGAGVRLQALDAVRGIAIALVVLWHYLPQPWSPARSRAFEVVRMLNVASWSGVDLFFVLSGFLIGGILIDNASAENYYRTFYLRRAYRILPLYVVLLVFAAFFIDLRQQWRPFAAYLGFQQNALMAMTTSWGLPRLEVTWSLAIEEQFYLVAPLMIRNVRRDQLPWLLAGAIAAALATRFALWMLLSPARAAAACFLLLPCRMDALACGMLVAYGVRDDAWRRAFENGAGRALGLVTGALGLGVPLINQWAWPSRYVSTIGFTLVASFYAVVVWIAAERRKRREGIAIRAAAVVGLGAYSIYLFHLSIRDLLGGALALRTSPMRLLGYTGLLIVVNAAIAASAWRWIERPMIDRGHRHRYRAPRAPSIEV
jgi:peptidoglycan/LPS O-acetylase OafA/YrhL